MFRWLFLLAFVFLAISITCLISANHFWDLAKEMTEGTNLLTTGELSAGSEINAESKNGMKSWIHRHKYFLEIVQSLLSLFLSITVFCLVLVALTTLSAFVKAIATFWQTNPMGMETKYWLLIGIFGISISILLFSLIVFHTGLVLLNPYGMDSLFFFLGIFAFLMIANTYRVCRRPL